MRKLPNWLVTLTGVLVAIGIFVLFTNTNSPASNEGAGGSSVVEVAPETIAVLTVTAADYHCATNETGSVVFDIGAVKPVPAERKWTDAMSTPFTASEPTPMVEELKVAICQDPLLGGMVANYFANLKVGDFDVGAANPWLAEFKLVSEVNTKATSYMSSDAQNIAWQEVAGKLNTLLSRFAIGGVEAELSVLNYHLLELTTGLPAVELNPKQEDMPAVRLSLTHKDQGCVLEIGFNTGDKRLEAFACKTPPEPSPSDSPSATPSTPGGTPSTTPPGDDKKDSNKDGGDTAENEDPGPGEYSPPDEMEQPPHTPYTPPPPPGGGSDPGDNDGTVDPGCGNPNFC